MDANDRLLVAGARLDSQLCPALTNTPATGDRVYYAGAGGTVYYRGNLDSNGGVAATQVVFYGQGNYTASPAAMSAFNSSVQINTPITSDKAGDIYFGYQASGSNPLNLQSGIARIAPDGSATYMPIITLAADASKVVQNCASALSPDGSTVYVAVNNGGGFGTGSLLGLNSTTLAMKYSVALKDPRNSSMPAILPDDGTASPTIGPNGDVYFGVLDNPFTTAKGWLLHFSPTLTQTVASVPGAFGWDDTASLVPATMVPSYHGPSQYLLMTKYNNYANFGGDGVNKLAILDPNATQVDPRTGVTVMKEVLTIAGPTPDSEFDQQPGLSDAVREWCINNAVVDPATHSILANSEDGNLYRWDLDTNTFSQVIRLTSGIGEAYTPTLIGQDGTVYAINNATLFAVVPEPSGILLCALGLAGLAVVAHRRR